MTRIGESKRIRPCIELGTVACLIHGRLLSNVPTSLAQSFWTDWNPSQGLQICLYSVVSSGINAYLNSLLQLLHMIQGSSGTTYALEIGKTILPF